MVKLDSGNDLFRSNPPSDECLFIITIHSCYRSILSLAFVIYLNKICAHVTLLVMAVVIIGVRLMMVLKLNIRMNK